MGGWGIAAALFAAGAFGLGLLYEVRRFLHRPTCYWAAALATRQDDDRLHRLGLQLIGDAPAYHVHVDPAGLELAHDPENHRTNWPHLGKVDASQDPVVMYVKETGEVTEPYVVVTWFAPPVRRERTFVQKVYINSDMPFERPRRMRPVPAWRRWWRKRRQR